MDKKKPRTSIRRGLNILLNLIFHLLDSRINNGAILQTNPTFLSIATTNEYLLCLKSCCKCKSFFWEIKNIFQIIFLRD